jgi:beta-lactam-binding protein with PASTA domain
MSDAGSPRAPREERGEVRVPPIAPEERSPAAMGPEMEPVALDELAPEVEAPPRFERRRGPRFSLLTGTLLFSAIALACGYLVVNLVLMPSLTRQGAEVPVPEVVGLSEVQAERTLAAEGLKLSKASEQWSPDVPRGFVMAQDPDAGSMVKRGRRISVNVSLGAQGTSVPVLEGETVRQAEVLLEGAGLRAGRIARVYSDEVGKDLVVGSDPPGETLVEQETVVNLLVSLGALPTSYVLPDLGGVDAGAATRALRDEGLVVVLREGGSREKSGRVGGQDPPPGRRVAPRDTVVLYQRP